jgi:cytochrome bd-type quinol oxidase subunit 2
LKALFIGTVIVMPFILGYTILAYRIFRGKAKAGLYD